MLKKGQLVRWVVDYRAFEAYNDSNVVRGIDPIYKYGIIMEVGSDNQSAAVCCYEKHDGCWAILNLIHDNLEVLS